MWHAQFASRLYDSVGRKEMGGSMFASIFLSSRMPKQCTSMMVHRRERFVRWFQNAKHIPMHRWEWDTSVVHAPLAIALTATSNGTTADTTKTIIAHALDNASNLWFHEVNGMSDTTPTSLLYTSSESIYTCKPCNSHKLELYFDDIYCLACQLI